MTEDFNAINLGRIADALERLADAADTIASLLAAPAALAATGPRLTGDPIIGGSVVAGWPHEAQPDADGWIEWNGNGDEPAPGDIKVEWKGDDGSTHPPIRASHLEWRKGQGTPDVTHYRIAK